MIVVDDIGLLPVSPDAADGFYRLVDVAYEKRSVAVSSNVHPAGAQRSTARVSEQQDAACSAPRAGDTVVPTICNQAPTTRL